MYFRLYGLYWYNKYFGCLLTETRILYNFRKTVEKA